MPCHDNTLITRQSLRPGACLPVFLMLGVQLCAAVEIEDTTTWQEQAWPSSPRNGTTVDRVVLHCTMALKDPTDVDPKTKKARPFSRAKWFDRDSIFRIWRHYKTQPHYFIDREGAICRLTDEKMQCSHAKGYNPRSIGIELAGIPNDQWVQDEIMDHALSVDRLYTDQQYASLVELLKDIQGRYSKIKLIRHSDIGRKAKITAATLNVRSEPNKKAQRVSSLEKGKIVSVVGAKGVWLMVQYAGKKEGWIHGKYVKNVQRKNDPGPHFDEELVTSRVSIDFVMDDCR